MALTEFKVRQQQRLCTREQGGFVLLSVLLFIGLLSALTIAIMADTVLASRHYTARSEMAKYNDVLDAALTRAIYALENPTDPLLRNLRASNKGAPWIFDSVNIRIELQPESGKLDLNTAEPRLLIAAIEKLFEDNPQVAAAISSRLWSRRQAGQRFAFVEAILEPADRLRYPREIVREVFTVHSEQSGFDPSSASERLLKASPGQSEESASKFISERAKGQLEPALLGHEVQAQAVREKPVYTVAAEIVEPGRYARREAVVLIEPNTQTARILSWESVVKPLPRSP